MLVPITVPDKTYRSTALVRSLIALAWRRPRTLLAVLILQILLLALGLAGVHFIGQGIDYPRETVDSAPKTPDATWRQWIPAAWPPQAALAVLGGFILLLSLGVYLAYMLWVHPGLTAACLASTPLLWLFSYAFSRRVYPLYLRSREKVDDLYRELGESIQGVQTIKSFAREPLHRERFRQINDDLRDRQGDIFRRVSRFSPTIGFFSQFNIFVLLAYGGWLVLEERLPLGSGLVVFATLLQQFSAQVSKVADLANSAQQSLTSARRLFAIFDAPVEIQSEANAMKPGRLAGSVEFRNVSFGYDSAHPVLRDLSFTAKPGQCVALLGTTGAGKSTLLSLIPRFYDPLRGQVLIDGRDVRDYDLHEFHRRPSAEHHPAGQPDRCPRPRSHRGAGYPRGPAHPRRPLRRLAPAVCPRRADDT